MPHRITSHTPEEQETIEARQRAEKEGNSEYIVLSRAEDRNFFLRMSYTWEKYRVLIYLAMAFLVAMGFDFKTPAQNYKILSDRIDVIAAQVRRDSAAKAEISHQLDILITFQCMSQNPRDMTIARVDCTKYITSPMQPKP
jgi:hypothetical protein